MRRWGSSIPGSRSSRTGRRPNRKGVVTYVEDGKPRGVLLWNVWDKVDAARDLIRAGEGAFAV